MKEKHKLTFDCDGTAKCSCGGFAVMTLGEVTKAEKKSTLDYHREHKRRALGREKQKAPLRARV